jgi:PAS domain S-box-containing protein
MVPLKMCLLLNQLRFLRNYLVIPYLFLLFSSPAFAQKVITIQDDVGVYSLRGPHLQIYEDKDKDLTIEQIISPEISRAFRPNLQDIPNFGYTHSAYWLQFAINNNTPEKKKFFLEISYALLDYVTLYAPDNQGKFIEKKSGRLMLFQEREVKHRNFVFPIDINPMEIRTYYLRMESQDSLSAPLKLFTPEAFGKKGQKEQYILGIFYGIIVAMILYNLFIYISLKELCYLYYVLFIGAFLIYILSENGVAYQYLWPNFPWWSKRAIPFHVAMVVIWSSFFVQKFLNTKLLTPRLHKAIYIFSTAGILGILFSLTMNYYFTIIYVVVLIFLYSPLLIATGYFCWRKGYSPGGYLLVAWAVLLLGSIAYALKAFGIFPEAFLTKYGVPIGAGIQVILLSIGLADRINAMKKDLQMLNKSLELREEKYRTILESIEEGYYEVDIVGNVNFVNDSMCKILKYSKDKLLGMHGPDYIDREHAGKIYQTFKSVYMSGEPSKAIDWEFIRKDGSRGYAEISVSLIKDSKDQVIGFRGIARDLTERRLIEKERKQLETQLQRAQKMEAIGTLAGGVAHDLNNILSGLVSYPGVLLMELPEDSPLREPLLTIKKSGQRAAAIVQDLLTLSRSNVSATEVINLNNIISEYLKSPEYKRLESYHPKVQVETNFEMNLLNILGSSVHLSKTVMNLISNAAEAMPEGGTVSISTENHYIDRPIRGHGIGISSEDKDRIFEPFYTKKKMGRSGTGLGMAVVWGTVKTIKVILTFKALKEWARHSRFIFL